jgi:hypothetical protein
VSLSQEAGNSGNGRGVLHGPPVNQANQDVGVEEIREIQS